MVSNRYAPFPGGLGIAIMPPRAPRLFSPVANKSPRSRGQSTLIISYSMVGPLPKQMRSLLKPRVLAMRDERPSEAISFLQVLVVVFPFVLRVSSTPPDISLARRKVVPV